MPLNAIELVGKTKSTSQKRPRCHNKSNSREIAQGYYLCYYRRFHLSLFYSFNRTERTAICLRRKSNHPKLWEANNAEAVVVVPVRRIVVVAIRNATVLSVVVPTTTTEHAIAANFL